MQNFSGHKENNWKDAKKQKLDGYNSKFSLFVTTDTLFLIF